MSKGTLFLIPTTLGGEQTDNITPSAVAEIAAGLRHFAVEEVKAARRYLRKIDRAATDRAASPAVETTVAVVPAE